MRRGRLIAELRSGETISSGECWEFSIRTDGLWYTRAPGEAQQFVQADDIVNWIELIETSED